MKLTFLVLAMMTCASELKAQNHINQLQGIIQSGMQPSTVPGPGTGVAVGPTHPIAQLQGIIQNGKQTRAAQSRAVAVGVQQHINQLPRLNLKRKTTLSRATRNGHAEWN